MAVHTLHQRQDEYIFNIYAVKDRAFIEDPARDEG